MKYEIIKTDEYLLAVDKEADILDGDGWYCPKNNLCGVVKEHMSYFINNENHCKLVAHLPLNNSKPLEGVYLLPELEKEYSDTILMDKGREYTHSKLPNLKGAGAAAVIEGYYDGYKAAGEYTEEDVRKAVKMAKIIVQDKDEFDIESISGLTEIDTYGLKEKYSEDEIIQSLKPIPIAFEVEMINSNSVAGPTAVSNNILQGKYIYGTDTAQ